MSAKQEWLVLVDDQDNELGVETREKCHQGKGLRHRAFVVFLFDGEGRMLLQRRSSKKLLWPGYWDVSYTSHVYRGETYEQAAKRRAKQELGIEVDHLERILSYIYTAAFGANSENEYCVLLTGKDPGRVHANPDEISETKYISVKELEADMKKNPDSYTPWFRIAFDKFIQDRS